MPAAATAPIGGHFSSLTNGKLGEATAPIAGDLPEQKRTPAVLGKQLPLDLLLSQIARSVSFNPGSIDNLPRIPVARLHADGIKEINVFPGLEAKILQKFFPLTGGLLSEDTYGFDISDNQPKECFNTANAFSCGKLSQLIYWPEETIIDTAKQWKIEDVAVIGADADLGQAILVRDPGMLAIVFRGTRPLHMPDWVADLQSGAALTQILLGKDQVRVHEGFNNTLNDVWNDILKQLTDWTSNSSVAEIKQTKLFITGHSLGAALATLCAARLQYDELPQRDQIPPVHAVYTFGSPRAGDMAFKDKYIQELDKITFRCVNNNDVVPQVPLDTIPDFVPTQLVSFVEGVKDNVVNTVVAVAGSIVDALHWTIPDQVKVFLPTGADALFYKHVGTEFYIDRHGHMLKGVGVAQHVDDRAKGLMQYTYKTQLVDVDLSPIADLITDHFMTSYLAALERNLMMVLLVKNLGQLGGEFNKWLQFIKDKNFLEVGHLYEAAETLEQAPAK